MGFGQWISVIAVLVFVLILAYEPLMKGYVGLRYQGKKSCSGPSMVSCLDELNNNSMFYKKLAVGSHYETGWVKKAQAPNNVIPISREKTLRNGKI